MAIAPLLILWIIFSWYIAKKNYIESVVLEDKFMIKFMNKEYQIDFSDIEYIIEFSDYTNPLKEKRDELKVSDKLNINKKVLSIENKAFSKWILSQDRGFIIKKNYL